MVVHDELRAAAYLNRRSVNSEVLFRISGGLSEREVGRRDAGDNEEPRGQTARSAFLKKDHGASRSESPSSFKPDFGGRLKG